MQKYMKGIAAMVGAVLSLAVAHFGLGLDVEATTASIMALISTVAVILAPKNAEE